MQQAIKQDTVLLRSSIATAPVNKLYNTFGYQPIWTDSLGNASLAQAAVGLLKRAPEFGLISNDYLTARLCELVASHTASTTNGEDRYTATERRIQLDLRLTVAMLSFITHLHSGRLEPYTTQPLEKWAANGFDAAGIVAKSVANPTAMVQTILAVQPQSRSYVR
ncbi:hypothetical protein ASU33_15675 [Solirubrum puertoriconensis]|uniref:L,D-transpeptidase scaffold domain-containing protein n=1 Tax=Solirubrum puertoriconensis TaxID=1751427 RepID=A0A9X0HKS0_SOLP1|nr:hypothetical protein ASU33_15675 [Solirubrum puertoriconensis]